MMVVLKRALVMLAELIPEAFLLGAVLAAWVWRVGGQRPWPADKPIALGFVMVAAVYGFAVAVILGFLHAYYATRVVLGLFWRSTPVWVYPTIAVALFIIHVRVMFMRSAGDLTPDAKSLERPFEALGACIVFACAFIGNRVLRKWCTRAAAAPNRLV